MSSIAILTAAHFIEEGAQYDEALTTLQRVIAKGQRKYPDPAHLFWSCVPKTMMSSKLAKTFVAVNVDSK